MRKLVLFDIDGTILSTGGIGGRSLYQAIEEVCHEKKMFGDNPTPELGQGTDVGWDGHADCTRYLGGCAS